MRCAKEEVHEANKIWPGFPLQCVVSLGLGRTDKFMQEKHSKKKLQPSQLTISQKFSRIVDSATDTELVHLSLQDLIPQRGIYYRFNPYLKELPPLDEIKETQFSMMKHWSRMYIRRNQRKFTDACYQLTNEKLPHNRIIEYLASKHQVFKAKYF